ncbi:MAG: hypothetical protein HYZ20_19940 [Burkholderiales bacterium]|nr:hypothetical protein [Burkholderiales bacterium]
MDMLIRLYALLPQAPADTGAGVAPAAAPPVPSPIASGLLRAGPGDPPAVTLRKPIGPEHDLIVAWVGREFGPGWASEACVALGNRPVSLFVAVESAPGDRMPATTQAAAPSAATTTEPAARPGPTPALLGFACYDATARGMVGPIGVADAARGRGVGAALLRACLRDMHAAGYAYAVAGGVGAPGFFRRVAGAVEIPDSSPGPYAGMLRHGPD